MTKLTCAFRTCLRDVLLSIDGQLQEFNIEIRHINKRASRQGIKKKGGGAPEILAKNIYFTAVFYRFCSKA